MKFEDAFSLNKREIVTLDDINQWYKNEKFFLKMKYQEDWYVQNVKRLV